MPRRALPLERRLLPKLSRETVTDLPDPCWIWTGGRHRTGYGILSTVHSQFEYVHRLAYRLWVGEIPPGCDVHHRCGIQPCCNPAHLDALPHEAHTRLHDHLGTGCAV